MRREFKPGGGVVEFLGYVPVALIIFPLIALLRLGSSAKRFSWQADRLNKAIQQFKSTKHVKTAASTSQPLPELADALSHRKQLLQDFAKSKQAKQRRLVKRLRDLTSQESEQ